MNVLTRRAAHRAALLSLASLGAVATGLISPACAQTANAQYQFDIPAQSLESALVQFTRITGVQLVYPASLAQGISSNGAQGRLTADEALARLLSGSGLTFRRLSSGSITIEQATSAGDGERVLGAVRVQGAQGSALAGSTVVNGVNGSRDVTATEGTGSYTSNALTVGSKTAQSIKDTPMAVSVITSAQIQDQNITDLNSAMRDAPGITVLHDTANDLSFYSRGFKITQLQIDGGAAQNFAANTEFYRPIIDMSLYDHVEIVRGATGTFNGYGSPGGVINLVRKRPLDHAQMLLDLQLGSWDWHRVSADITGPIGFGGKLRGRLIATHQDNNFFYDISSSTRNVISATLELDVTPTTLVTAGGNYENQTDEAGASGLMRYTNGKPIPFARSTCLCSPSSSYDRSNLELFGQLEQKLGQNWNLKLKGTWIRQRSNNVAIGLYGAADPTTGIGPGIADNGGSVGRTRQSLFEATLDGSFRMFGQTQKVILGANYSMFNPGGSYETQPDFGQSSFLNGAGFSTLVGNIRSFDPNNWLITASANSLLNVGIEYGDFRYINSYLSLDLSPLARLHIITSLRYSVYRSRSLSYYICGPDRVVNPGLPACFGKPIGTKWFTGGGGTGKGSSFAWPPSVQIKYDINKNLTAYAGYTDIYIDRSQLITSSNGPLPPTTGQNYEGGLKWLSPGKRLNVDLSVFYTKQINVDAIQVSSGGSPISSGPSDIPVGAFCCYANVDGSYRKSYGLDFEVTGEISKGWQASANYTYNYAISKKPGAVYFDGSPRLLQSQAPRHLLKFWSTYEFDDRSVLKGLRFGLGANARDKTFVSDTYCPQPLVRGPFGNLQCPVSNVPTFFTDKGYVVFNGSVGYKISDKLRVDAELENLLDRTYYEQVGGVNGGNWYGAPRSIKVTLRGKF